MTVEELVRRAVGYLVGDDAAPDACPHVVVLAQRRDRLPMALCLLHPEAGLMCAACEAEHSQRHAPRTCDVCGLGAGLYPHWQPIEVELSAVWDRPRLGVGTSARGIVFLAGLVACERCGP